MIRMWNTLLQLLLLWVLPSSSFWTSPWTPRLSDWFNFLLLPFSSSFVSILLLSYSTFLYIWLFFTSKKDYHFSYSWLISLHIFHRSYVPPSLPRSHSLIFLLAQWLFHFSLFFVSICIYSTVFHHLKNPLTLFRLHFSPFYSQNYSLLFSPSQLLFCPLRNDFYFPLHHTCEATGGRSPNPREACQSLPDSIWHSQIAALL